MTTKTKSEYKLVEHQENERGDFVVIDDITNGRRLLIRETYLYDVPEGWTMAAWIRATDTIESLESEEWNPHTNALCALWHGYSDNGRRLLDWNSEIVQTIANRVGL